MYQKKITEEDRIRFYEKQHFDFSRLITKDDLRETKEDIREIKQDLREMREKHEHFTKEFSKDVSRIDAMLKHMIDDIKDVVGDVTSIKDTQKTQDIKIAKIIMQIALIMGILSVVGQTIWNKIFSG